MKNAVLIPNTKKDVSLQLTKEISAVLLSAGAKLRLSKELADSGIVADYVDRSQLFDEADFVVTVGGDGTILGVAEELSDKGTPVIGVNLGRLGFMAELEPSEIGLLKKVLTDDFAVDKRMMLDISVIRNGETVASYRALNDVVVGKGSISKIAELELLCNATHVSDFKSDGLIVSTPTGSTAYSLSAGGTIIDTSIDCILLTPVCPHSFNNSRPIVFSSASILEIKDVQDGDSNTYLTVDGKSNEKLYFSDVVRVVASKKTTDLIRLKSEEFYNRVYLKIAERK